MIKIFKATVFIIIFNSTINGLFFGSEEEELCNLLKNEELNKLSKCQLLERISFLEIFIEKFIKSNFEKQSKILDVFQKYSFPKNSMTKRKNEFIR